MAASVVFIGRDNLFNRRLIHQLSADHLVRLCIFVENDRHSVRGILRRIINRIKRYGLFKVLDELAFHIFDRLVLRRQEKEIWRESQFLTPIELSMPTYVTDNVHDDECLDMIRKLNPDIIFSLCCGVIFKKELYNIPKNGTYMLHEGILPHYRGLHSTLWALAKDDYENVGATLFRVNDTVDGGEIVLQWKVRDFDGCRNWGWTAHRGHIDAIPSISKVFQGIAVKPGTEMSQEPDHYYTWMQLSQFLSLRLRSRLVRWRD